MIRDSTKFPKWFRRSDKAAGNQRWTGKTLVGRVPSPSPLFTSLASSESGLLLVLLELGKRKWLNFMLENSHSSGGNSGLYSLEMGKRFRLGRPKLGL